MESLTFDSSDVGLVEATVSKLYSKLRIDAVGQLRLADPARETVTAVAYRWGFSNPSRFTAYNRRAYGTVPRQTLYK